MKLSLLIMLAVLPVATVAAQTSQESPADTQHEAVSNTSQPKPAISTQADDTAIDDPIDPLPISKKKCLAVDAHGFCSQWATH